MTEANVTRDVLAQFAINATAIQPLGNAGGFSGACIFKVVTAEQTYCLKKWPDSTDIDNLHWIHRVLVFAAANGCPELTTPRKNLRGKTILLDSHGIWELTNWAAGSANYAKQPTFEKLNSAIQFLARFHQATARFHFNFTPSRNIKVALERLQAFDSIVAAVAKAQTTEDLITKQQLDDFSQNGRALAIALAQKLVPLQSQPLPVQPVIRDFRAEHLFFEGDDLVSVIDFGAMRIDSVACDLSRIIGDTIGDDESESDQVLQQYNAIRPLQPTEWQLSKLLNQSSVIVGILNWLDWLIIQRRDFDESESVRARLKTLFRRFQSWNEL